MSVADEREGGSRRTRLFEFAAVRGIPLGTILTTITLVVVVYLAGRLIYKLREIVLLIVVAGFIALLLNGAVVGLIRLGLVRRRGSAVAIVTVLFLVSFAALTFAFGYPLVHALTHLAENLPKYVREVEHGKGWLGHLFVKYHVRHWVETSLAPKLSEFAKNLSKPALSLGKGAVSLIVAMLTIFVLVLLLLLEGSKLRGGLLRMMDPARAERTRRIANEVSRAVTGYMLGNFLTSVIAGLVVFITLTIVGVPFAVLFGLWVALLDFLPMIGGALAGIPTVLFALAHSLTAGIVTLVVFLAYTQVENHILNPIVMSRTVRINPLLVVVAILVGATVGDLVGGFFGGFVGTLLSIPLAGAIQVLVHELWQATEPTPSGARAPDADAPPEVP